MTQLIQRSNEILQSGNEFPSLVGRVSSRNMSSCSKSLMYACKPTAQSGLWTPEHDLSVSVDSAGQTPLRSSRMIRGTNRRPSCLDVGVHPCKYKCGGSGLRPTRSVPIQQRFACIVYRRGRMDMFMMWEGSGRSDGLGSEGARRR